MIILGISGKKETGKDTLATIIKSHTSMKVERIGFADALKLEVAQACHISVKELETNKKKYRTILQWWGTEFRRAQNEKYWLDKWANRCLKSEADLVICPDVRFVNEYECLKALGTPIVRLTRNQFYGDLHSSECELDRYMFDYEHTNDTMDGLHAFARVLLSRLTQP